MAPQVVGGFDDSDRLEVGDGYSPQTRGRAGQMGPVPGQSTGWQSPSLQDNGDFDHDTRYRPYTMPVAATSSPSADTGHPSDDLTMGKIEMLCRELHLDDDQRNAVFNYHQVRSFRVPQIVIVFLIPSLAQMSMHAKLTLMFANVRSHHAQIRIVNAKFKELGTCLTSIESLMQQAWSLSKPQMV